MSKEWSSHFLSFHRQLALHFLIHIQTKEQVEGDGQEDAAYIRFDILHTYPLLLTVSFHLYYKFEPVRDEIEIEFPTDINY